MNWLLAHLSAHATALQNGDLVKLGVLITTDVLLIFSLSSIAVIVERAVNLKAIRQLETREYATLRKLSRDDRERARAQLAQSEAPVACAVRDGLELESAGTDVMREAMAQGLEVQSARLSRNLPLLATVASTAPYIGLLGTVLGILSAFASIARTGQTGASVVAAPIAEALTATALGLGVAIPAVMAYNFYSGRVNDLMLQIETHALEIGARILGVTPKPDVAASNLHSNGALAARVTTEPNEVVSDAH